MGPLGAGLVALEAIGGPLDGDRVHVPATARQTGDVHHLRGCVYVVRWWPVYDKTDGGVCGARKVLCASGVRVPGPPGAPSDPGEGAEA